MKQLFISIETLSSKCLKDVGVYRYTELPAFSTPLIAAAFDDMPVRIIDMCHGEAIPSDIRNALLDPECRKIAFDAQFNRVCLSKMLGMPVGTYLPPEQWSCLKSKALYKGMPDDMKPLCRMLKIVESYGDEMTDVLRRRCFVLRKKNRTAELNAEWPLYQECLRAKLNSIRMLSNRLDSCPMPDAERQLYIDCQQINDRGIKVDTRMVDNAIHIYDDWRNGALYQLYLITGVRDIKDVERFKLWLTNQGVAVKDLSQSSIEKYLTKYNFYPVNAALTLWQHLNRSAIAKYRKIQDCVSADGRLRGAYTYCGANAGRFGNGPVQLDNLPVSELSNLVELRELICENDVENLDKCGFSIPSSLSELVTTVFIPDEERTLRVYTYNALEKSVENWLFGENGIDEFCRKLDIGLDLLMKRDGKVTVGKITVRRNGEPLEVVLPSGRVLAYRDFYWWEPGLITFTGYDDHHRWVQKEQNTAKIAYDIVSAVSRDILSDAIERFEAHGSKVVMFYPGTIITECSAGEDDFDPLTRTPQWTEAFVPRSHIYSCCSFLEKSTDVKRRC